MSEATKTRPMGRIDAQGRVIPGSFDDLSFRGEFAGTNMTYKGFARPGAAEGSLVWQVAKMTYDVSNNLTEIKWPEDANGNASTEYEFSWTDRATYTFS